VIGRGEGDEHAKGRGLSLIVHTGLRTALGLWMRHPRYCRTGARGRDAEEATSRTACTSAMSRWMSPWCSSIRVSSPIHTPRRSAPARPSSSAGEAARTRVRMYSISSEYPNGEDEEGTQP
jgi:hypothetical protein